MANRSNQRRRRYATPPTPTLTLTEIEASHHADDHPKLRLLTKRRRWGGGSETLATLTRITSATTACLIVGLGLGDEINEDPASTVHLCVGTNCLIIQLDQIREARRRRNFQRWPRQQALGFKLQTSTTSMTLFLLRKTTVPTNRLLKLTAHSTDLIWILPSPTASGASLSWMDHRSLKLLLTPLSGTRSASSKECVDSSLLDNQVKYIYYTKMYAALNITRKLLCFVWLITYYVRNYWFALCVAFEYNLIF